MDPARCTIRVWSAVRRGYCIRGTAQSSRIGMLITRAQIANVGNLALWGRSTTR